MVDTWFLLCAFSLISISRGQFQNSSAISSPTRSTSGNNATQTFALEPTYISSCGIEYRSWYAGSSSISPPNHNPTAPPPTGVPGSIAPSPSCCSSLEEQVQQAESAWWDSANAQTYVTATVTTSYIRDYTYDRAWFDCEVSRTSLGPVYTWIDGFPHRSASIATTTCSESSRVPDITYGTSTSIVGFPDQPKEFALASAACNGICGQCNIMNGGFLDVLYWPVSLGYSGNSSYTITPTATELVTAVYGTYILTSPTVYISYSTLFAGYGFFTNANAPDAPCASQYKGKRYSDVIIPIPTDQPLTTYDLSYSEYEIITQTSSQFNYADMPPNPLPAAKWSQSCSFLFNMNQTTGTIHGPNVPGAFPHMTLPGDPDLTWHPCSTVTDGVYRPLLRQPIAVRDFDPEWKDCQFLELDGLIAPRDPPYALTRQVPINAPTVTTADNGPTQIPAEPAHEPTMFVPETTAPGLTAPQPTPLVPGSPMVPGTDPVSGSNGASDSDDPGTSLGSNLPYSGGGSDTGVGAGSGNYNPPKNNTPQPPAATFTIGTQTFTAHPSNPIALPGVTLQPSAEAVTISGHTISLAPSGVIIDGTLKPFITPAAGQPGIQVDSHDDVSSNPNYTPGNSSEANGGTNIVAIIPNGPPHVGSDGNSGNAVNSLIANPTSTIGVGSTITREFGGGDDIMNIEGGTKGSGGQNIESPGRSTGGSTKSFLGIIGWKEVILIWCFVWLL